LKKKEAEVAEGLSLGTTSSGISNEYGERAVKNSRKLGEVGLLEPKSLGGGKKQHHQVFTSVEGG